MTFAKTFPHLSHVLQHWASKCLLSACLPQRLLGDLDGEKLRESGCFANVNNNSMKNKNFPVQQNMTWVKIPHTSTYTPNFQILQDCCFVWRQSLLPILPSDFLRRQEQCSSSDSLLHIPTSEIASLYHYTWFICFMLRIKTTVPCTLGKHSIRI